MPESDRTPKVTARQCPACGLAFDPTIKFCPEDGSRLSEEVRLTGEIRSISNTVPPAVGSGDSGSRLKGRPNDAPRSPTGNDNTKTLPADPASYGRTGEPSIPTANLPKPIAVSAADSMIGAIINDQYEIMSVIGHGGMSIVYKARHLMMKRLVAVKTLLPHLVLHPLSLERFRQEAEAASNLAHPNIITIYDFGFTSEGQPFLVMDYLQGTSLSALIRRDRYLPVERACHIFKQIADALGHAHSHGVIHRDLKPSNILLVEKGDDPYYVQIVDFGIAKLLPREDHEYVSLTQTGELFGSPLYMSPEQCKGGKLDAKSDIYSLGCLMYETLCGKPPIDGDATLDILYKHINEIPEPLSNHGVKVPRKLETMVFKCLAKSPSQRYRSMEQVRDQLLDMIHERKSTFFDKLFNAWTLFLLRRKPRSNRDKAFVLVETAMLLVLFTLATTVGLLEWRAAESPASKQAISWVEDEPEQPQPPSSQDFVESTNLDVGYRQFNSHELSPEQSLQLIDKYMKFGQELMSNKCFDMASDAYGKALKVSRDFNGLRAFKTFFAWAHYADALSSKRDPNAPAVYREMLTEIMRHSGIDDWYMCELFKKEGDSYYVLGQWAQAANSYSQSLRYFNAGASAYQELGKDRESDSHFDPNDDAVVLDTTLMRSRLGDCYSILAEQPGVDTKQMLTTAENLYFRSLNSWRKLRGDFSGDEMVTIYRLAHVQARLGHTSSARTFYKEALDHCIKIYGAKNVYTGLLLRDYADFLWHSNSWLEALYYRVWSLTILASAK